MMIVLKETIDAALSAAKIHMTDSGLGVRACAQARRRNGSIDKQKKVETAQRPRRDIAHTEQKLVIWYSHRKTCETTLF